MAKNKARILLSWNEIRDRASKFAHEWEGETRESGEYQSFWDEFFHIFGARRRSMAVYQKKVELLRGKRGYIDLFWPGVLLAEHKSAGEDLDAAFTQATDYFSGIDEPDRPRYVIVTDYQRIRFYDLEGESGIEEIEFPLKDLAKQARRFDFIAGYQVREFKEEDPINIKAVQVIGKLFETLKDSHYPIESASRLLTRLVFCFFADDVGIFNRDTFKFYLEEKTKEDGSDLGAHISHIFEVLNTAPEARQTTLDEDLQTLPYVNGGLFDSHLPVLSGTSEIRKALLKASSFDWSAVSPAIFGSMFQSVMDDKQRHDLGAHYTSEKNIMKVVSGLFLDDLYKEFNAAGRNGTKLDALWNKISHIHLLDPACGCGNFLVISYRELRKLELEIFKKKYYKLAEQVHGGQSTLGLPFDVTTLSKLSVERMFGIEIEDFPTQIAQLSLWLTDHMANMELGNYFGTPFQKLPLTERPHIVKNNALQIDWNDVVPNEKLTYILGNPPFLGHHLQTEEQKEDLRSVLSESQSAGVMDYVSAWFVKAARFIQETDIICAFVSTNSITQGEQVGILWGDILFPLNIKIHFAHRTFKWSNEAPGKAAVYCVIIGFGVEDPVRYKIYEYEDIRGEPHEVLVNHINPYLIDAPDVVVRNRTKPLCNVPQMKYGNKATDGGHFILSREEKEELLLKEPQASKFIKRYLGAEDFLNGGERWCIWLVDAEPQELKQSPEIMKRIDLVKDFRSKSKAVSTRNYPYHSLFRQITQPKEDYILVPRVSSESRRYVPIGFFSKEMIISDSCQAVPEAGLYHFGVLESEMHMTWMRSVAGRLKSDYRYSKDIVYNNFPWPKDPSEPKKQAVEEAAQKVLDTRAEYSNATLAELYNPETMPKPLTDAHHMLDKVIDECYGKKGFKGDKERLEFLFELYKSLI